jgi:ADP-ribose pyrophosphatase
MTGCGMSFTIINQDTVYNGKIFKIDSVLLEFPDGHQARYEIVKHNPSVTILPVDAEGFVYLVKQYRLGAGEELLELPAGVIDIGEAPDDCARREIREEIGQAAGRITALGQAYLVPGYGNELMYFFLAEDLSSNPLRPDPDEFLQLEKYTIRDMYYMAEQGKLQDSKTLAALTLARPVLMGR